MKRHPHHLSPRRRSLLAGLLAAFLLAPVNALTADADQDGSKTIRLQLRSRQETAPGSGPYHAVVQDAEWKARQTAVVVCDMWDLHHCLNATRRGTELAPRMNQLLKEARRRGVTIIHAPSSCMPAYKDHPARIRAVSVPRSRSLPKDIGKWCHRIPSEEKGKYPIDQSDGGEDDDPDEHAAWAKKLKDMGRNPRAPWKTQTDLLEIDAEQDFISDDGEEIWSIMDQRDIDNVILVGVHTNMCVLGRPFGLRQMAKNGKNVVLMRDMTDTMYNPLRPPYVSHFTGTDLIVGHIEKFVCPTATSDQLLGGRPFRFKNDRRPRLTILMAEREYKTDRTLPQFAVDHLGKHFHIQFLFADSQDRNNIPGAEAADQADVLLVSVRRRALPPEQMAAIRKFVDAGKPVIGIRTANHAFSLRGKEPPESRVTWEDFDATVIGGHYTGHHGNGPKVHVTAASGAEEHAVLKGVDLNELVSSGSLYKVSPLADSATPVLIGSIPNQPPEPVAWINQRDGGGRTFYTSLGHPDDFKQPAFNRFLRNVVYWMAEIKVSDVVKPGY